MKIAVAALNKDQNSEISSKAGRAPFFLIFDEKAALLEALKNPFKAGGGGAGFGVAKMLEDKRITAVVAGQFGPNMKETLGRWKIRSYEMQGTVLNSLSRIQEMSQRDI